MKNTITGLLVCCALVLSWACSKKQATPEKASAPDPSPTFEPHTATIAQQKMCDEQAAKRFNEYTEQKERDLDSYTSHFDPAVNVCYVRVNHTLMEAGIPGNSATITDAFEGRVYATYFWSNPQGKKYWEVAPTDCEINVPGKDAIRCTSSDEFDSLTEKYFGIAK